jgi:hypothetical protein
MVGADDSSGTQVTREIPLEEFIPDDWKVAGTTSVWIRLYRAFRVSLEELRAAAPVEARPTGLRVSLLIGKPKHPRRGTITLVSEVEWHIEQSADLVEAPEGAYVMLITPFATAEPGDEPATVNLIDATAGALAAICGRNAVFERVSDYEYHLDQRMSSRELAWENPIAFDPPRLGARHATVYSVLARILDDNAPRRSKTLLSLRWLEAATRAGGVDAYLKYWIALETLLMTSFGDFSPIVESLSRAYSITSSEAGQRFAIGRMFGLRGRILHAGKQPPIHGTLLQYIEAICGDLLLETYGLPTFQRAAEVLARADFSLLDALNVGFD